MKAQEFINLLAPIAVSEQRRTGVLASITLAQGALESAWGSSAPGNNLFGIKGTGQELSTKEYVNGTFIDTIAGFRSYTDWEGSVTDHSNFLIENPRYAEAGFFICCAALDYAGAARSLQIAGYATDPGYAEKLIQIIKSYGLDRYDRLEEDEDNMPMKLEQWQWDMLYEVLGKAYNDGQLNWSWMQKIVDKTMTAAELAFLNTILDGRIDRKMDV
ncbi:glycoside hydrolase family 73 protein [Paenibacillus sp. OAS669]|uniref:glycoside hydrolase family 73 protein n=1 Tax=Paenibacillus sp. OAS669 TaxID=2663821 RepID=UPI00178AFBBD|nr:glycoside hydrolase family 73 protein [Paenibacillus sp. OAS669]MBE1442942.1 flagellum-specific peptidoglycan hydrolase FlgJ [Paenibacillus sp. OAS669]